MIRVFLRLPIGLMLLLHITFNGYAQTAGNGKYQVFAPNTFEFARYADVPVDYSSGVPQISIPLTKMIDKDISVDVSLSYHSGGIKVDQEATWVGLGWSLNSGGVITREVRGLADGFNSSGFFKSRTSIADYQPGGGQTMAQYASQAYTSLYSAANNATDNGADFFYYNFGGRAGKFFLDSNRNAIFTRHEDIKVAFEPVYTNGHLTGSQFTITDERGVQYEFKDQETTFSPAENYISAWYLSKITSPSGGNIIIEYEGGGLSAVQFQKRCFNEAYFAINPAHGQHFLPNQYVLPCIGSDGGVSGLVPRRIITSAGHSLEFVATGGRLDSEPSLSNNKLSTLILRDNMNAEIRRFNFSHGYFEANNSRKLPGIGPADNRNFLNYRLRLDAIQEVSSAGTLNPPYTFTYVGDNNPETDDVLTLPYRLSPSQDHWGYYNGTNNATIFPANGAGDAFHVDDVYRNTLPGGLMGGWAPGFTYWIANGGNREVDEEAMKAGSLKRIVYPTGGYAEFEFEGHNISVENFWPLAGGLRIKQVELNSGSGPSVIKQYDYLSYMASDKCLSLANRYYRWFWNWEANTSYSEPIAQTLMAFGVPSDLAYNNTYVVRGEGTSQLVLGAGSSAIYTMVKEAIPGNGYTTYQYNFTIDGESGIGGGDASEWSLFPGLFNAYYVDVYNTGGWGQQLVTLNSSSCIFPYPNFFNNDWRRGHLTFREVYTESGTLLEKEEIRYQIQATAGVPGYSVIAWPTGGSFIYARYYNVGGLVKPIKEIRTVYSNGIALETTKDIEYTSTAHKQVTETRQTVNNGEVITTKYYYPTDYPNTFAALKSKNILAPVDTRSYKNNKLIAGQQVSYTDAGLPAAYYQAETNMSNIAFSPSTPFTFSPRLEAVYNADHTLRSQSDVTGSREIFLWSYKGSQPVARIENASYAEVLAALNDPNEIFVNELRNKAEPSITDLTALNALRQHTSLNQALITTYTHKPLVGMISQTDPRNRTIYYEYDGFHRLRLIRDQDNNILKQFEYQYQIPTHNNPIWQTTGQTRCKPCPENSAYTTNILQNEEKDNNPNSPTYYQIRWTDAGVSGTCTITADWQFVGSPRCRTENGVNTGQREQEKRDQNPCSPTYNQNEWVAIDMNCSTCPAPASWWANGTYRCATDGNNNNTGRRERMEVDQSRCSPTWLQFRWVDDGEDCATCPTPSNWQPTGATRCQKNQYNSNTSFIEIQEQDMSACIPAYRWVLGPQNLTACPFCFKCVGEGRLCLNDACIFGVKIYTGALQDAVTLKWTCIYHYEWNNGAIWSQDYTEESDRECTVN